MNAHTQITHPHLSAQVACPFCNGGLAAAHDDTVNDELCHYCEGDATADVTALFDLTNTHSNNLYHVDHETVLEIMDSAGLDWEAFA